VRVKTHNQKTIEKTIKTSRHEHACINILLLLNSTISGAVSPHPQAETKKHEMCFDTSDKQTNDVLTLPGTC